MEGAAVRRSASGGEGGDTSRQRAASTNASQRFGAGRRPMPPSAYSGESSLGYDAGEYYGDSVGETQMANGSPSAASVEKAVVNGSASGSNSQVQPSPVENGPEVSSVPDAADPLPTPTEEVKAGQSMAASEPDETPQHSDAMDLPSEKEIKSLKVAGLRELCGKYKLKKGGKKAELQQRLLDHIGSASTAAHRSASGGEGGETSRQRAGDRPLPPSAFSSEDDIKASEIIEEDGTSPPTAINGEAEQASTTVPHVATPASGYVPFTDPYQAEQELTRSVPLEEVTVQTQPLDDGKWDPSNPLEWAKGFGSRSAEIWADIEPQICLKPGDEGYFDNNDFPVPNVSIVRTKEEARKVMEKLMNADPSILHACDTEVMSIDLKDVGPVGNGYVTCASVYSGPDFDYGLGDGPGTVLWIDNLDEAVGILQEFKPWFEDERFLKVWHNYGFDRHVMFNEGIDVRGFGGDTMHMARLENTGRLHLNTELKGYSLEALTANIVGRRKKPMKEIFGVPRLRKDGTPGSIVDIPPIEVMQRDHRFRKSWILYSAYDAEGTWLLQQELANRLQKKDWKNGYNLFDYYWTFLRHFGEVLTDMERRGIRVDTDYLADVEVQARKDRERHLQAFREWAATLIGPDGLAINPASSVQLCTFLFGGAQNTKTKEETEKVRVFKVPREEIPDNAMEAYRTRDEAAMTNPDGSMADSPENQEDEFDQMKAGQLKDLCKEFGLKQSGKKSELQERLRGHFLSAGMQENGNGEDFGGVPSSEEDFDSMDINDLRDACIARGLSDNGNEAALRKALKEDTAYSLEIFSEVVPKDNDAFYTISQALERAANRDGNDLLKETLAEIRAKNAEEPKYVDVTITSIGMEPEKYTVGGAPSVTAAVLKKLAGDPLGDDPKYGTAYEFFGGGKVGHDACVALYSLTAIGSIDTMVSWVGGVFVIGSFYYFFLLSHRLMPAGFFYILFFPSADWQFYHEPPDPRRWQEARPLFAQLQHRDRPIIIPIAQPAKPASSGEGHLQNSPSLPIISREQPDRCRLRTAGAPSSRQYDGLYEYDRCVRGRW